MNIKVNWEKTCYLKIHRHGEEIVLALCDEELLGKTIKEGNLRFNISEKFYKGEKVTLKEAARYIEIATIINAVGENVIKMLVYHNEDILDAIIWLGKVPHVQLIK